MLAHIRGLTETGVRRPRPMEMKRKTGDSYRDKLTVSEVAYASRGDIGAYAHTPRRPYWESEDELPALI